MNRPATAAYNFISLPDKIMPAELDKYHDVLLSEDEQQIHNAFADFLQTKGTLSGYITMNIKTLTPLFIGGNNEQPFAPAGRIILPGSSLRGMVKNILKIITCGSWHSNMDINDRHIFYRCLMARKKDPQWKKDLNQEYTKRMISKCNGKYIKNANLGFLLRMQNGKYYIAPLWSQKKIQKIEICVYEDRFGKIPKRMDINQGHQFVKWDKDAAYIITGKQGKDKKYIRYIKLSDVNWASLLEVPEDVIKNYKEDKNRRGADLLNGNGSISAEKARALGINVPNTIDSIISCGYLENNGKVTAFGHGLCFRIPYQRDIMDAIPINLKKDTIDFATAIFGNKEHWAGRVSFEDAEPVEITGTESVEYAHPLLQPNPTSYQLYLDQENESVPQHWDAKKEMKIRGYKMYWHNPQVKWQATSEEKEDDSKRPRGKKILHRITPVKKGSKFQAKIRFKNLSMVELGALLMVFNMADTSDKIAYKIGGAKSLGLGSIRIQAALYLDDKDIYTHLFTNGSLQDNVHETDSKEYLKAFKDYVKSAGLERCWENTMSQLSEMLNWKHATETENWSNQVKAMGGKLSDGKFKLDERFLNRTILPTIHEVFNNLKTV